MGKSIKRLRYLCCGLLWCILNISTSNAIPTVIKSFFQKGYTGNSAVVLYNSTEGLRRLNSTPDKKAFIALSAHYSAQAHLLSCGIASSVIILNTIYANLHKEPPLSEPGTFFYADKNLEEGHFIWTEENFFSGKVLCDLNKNVIYGRAKIKDKYVLGMSLDQLYTALIDQGLSVEKFPVESTTTADIDKFRQLLVKVMLGPSHYIIVNYNLKVMGMIENSFGGHIAPLAAFDPVSDSVLIMDTWNVFGSWVWIKLEDLYKNMLVEDSKQRRGYLLIEANKAGEPLHCGK